MDLDLLDMLAFVALAVACAGGVGWAVIVPMLGQQGQSEKRLSKHTTIKRDAVALSGRNDRRRIEDSLKMLEERQKSSSKPTLPVRIEQSGLSISVKDFYLYSAGAGFAGAAVGYLLSGAPMIILGAAFAFGLGFPQWLLGFLKSRRIAAFTEELPNAVDAIVRGVKAGLPASDCMRMLAAEAKEPLRSEFRAVLDQTMLGIPLGEAVMKLHERIPTPEANFFSIVMSIQAKSGGSLAETLGNLARVLRDRKKMKAKISAMSQEAKSSAAIIGALPFLVTGLVYMSAPEYIILLFNTHTGNMMLLACIFWMTCGVLVMRHMINFDF
jgi:tight adherence protein B